MFNNGSSQKTAFLLVINGCPATGKTSLALELAKRLRVDTIVQTDVIKEVIRSFNPSSPACGNSHNVWKLLGEKNKKNILKGLQMHIKEYEDVLPKIALQYLSNGISIIIEGVQVTPEIFSKIDWPNKIGVFLRMHSKRTQFARFDLKNKQRTVFHSQWYENHDCMKIIDKYLSTEARKMNYLIPDNYKSIKEIADIVINDIKTKSH